MRKYRRDRIDLVHLGAELALDRFHGGQQLAQADGDRIQFALRNGETDGTRQHLHAVSIKVHGIPFDANVVF